MGNECRLGTVGEKDAGRGLWEKAVQGGDCGKRDAERDCRKKTRQKKTQGWGCVKRMQRGNCVKEMLEGTVGI